MTWIQLLGPVAGVLGLTVTLANILRERRRDDRTDRVETDRLGHDQLVAALEERRQLYTDLQADLKHMRAEHDREVKHMKAERDRDVSRLEARAEKAERQANDLFLLIARKERDP